MTLSQILGFPLIIGLIIITIVTLASGTTLNDKLPSQGYLYKTKPSNNSEKQEDFPVCGVSIITRRHVITSAFCVHEDNRIMSIDGLFVIYGGKNNNYSTTTVASIHPYRRYHPVTPWKNNIAVLKVAPDFVFDEWTSQVTLSAGAPLHYDEIIYFAEWTSSPSVKQHYELTISNFATLISNDQCQIDLDLRLTLNQFCAVTCSNNQSCTIGNGAGLIPEVTGLHNGVPVKEGVLVGIQSSCRPNKGPRIYVDVRKYIPWIAEVVGKDGPLRVITVS